MRGKAEGEEEGKGKGVKKAFRCYFKPRLEKNDNDGNRLQSCAEAHSENGALASRV